MINQRMLRNAALPGLLKTRVILLFFKSELNCNPGLTRNVVFFAGSESSAHVLQTKRNQRAR